MTKVRLPDGSAAELDPAEAQLAYQRGQVELDGPVQLVRGKEAGEVDVGDVSTALAQGWEFATPEQQRRAQLREQESDIGSNVQGFAEQAFSGLTLGLGDPLLVGMGVDPELMQLRAEELDGGATLAQVVGGALPSLATGGSGLVATAARLTPAGRAAMLGRGAAGGVEALLGSTAKGRIAGAVVGGAVEGALGGAGMEISAAALGKRELAAEQLWASAGRGAGLGALLGGSTVGVGEGLASAYAGTSRVSKSLLELAVGAGDDVASPAGLAAAAGDTLVDRAAMRQVDLLAKAAGHGPEQAAALRGAAERQLVRTRTAAGRELLEQAATVRSARQLDELAEPRVRPHLEQATADLDDLVGQAEQRLGYLRRQAPAAVEKVRQTAAEMVGDPGRFGWKLSRRNRQALEQVLSRAPEDGAAGSYRWLRDSVAELNVLKPKGEGAEAIAAIRSHLADTLDGPVFGDRARAYGQLLDAKAAAAAKPLKPRPSSAELDELLDARTKVVALAQDAGLDTRKAAGTLEQLRAGRRYRTELEAAAADHAALQALQDGVGATVRRGLELAGEGAGAVLGGLSFGGAALGRLVGLVAGMGTRPAQAYRTIARARGMIERVRGSQGETLARVEQLLDHGVQRAGRAGRVAGKGLGRVSASAGRKASHERRKRLTEAIGRVTRLAAQPLTVADEIGPSLAELHASAPDVATAMVEGAARAVQYLAAVAPPTYRPPGSDVVMVALEHLDAFEHRLEAVEDPLGTMRRLGSGSMTREHAEALEAVYPELYRELQDGILELVGSRGNKISFEARLQLGRLGSVVTDDSLRPEDFAQIQASVAPPATPPPMPAPPSASSAGLVPPPSRWEAMEGRR